MPVLYGLKFIIQLNFQKNITWKLNLKAIISNILFISKALNSMLYPVFKNCIRLLLHHVWKKTFSMKDISGPICLEDILSP